MHGERQTDDGGERDVPVPAVGRNRPDGMPSTWLAAKAVCTNPSRDRAMQREQIGDDGEHDGAHHAAEHPGDDPAQQKQMIIRSERPSAVPRGKADIKEQQAVAYDRTDRQSRPLAPRKFPH